MAQGSIHKRLLTSGDVRYDIVLDIGVDPVTGERRQRKKSFKTKKEAVSARTAWLSEIDRGVAVDRNNQTVAEMLRYWLETHAKHHVRPRTYEDYERSIVKHIIPLLGSVSVQKLTPDQLQKFYSDKLAMGCGTRTVELCHLRLSQALEQAMKLGLVARNVADLVTPPREDPKEMHTWTVAEAQTFLKVASQSTYGPIWLLALATGMRRGELLGLRWCDVDFGRSVVHIRQAVGRLGTGTEIKAPKTKTSRREVSVQPQVIAALQEHHAKQNDRRAALGQFWHDHDLVFAAANGNPINPDNLKRDYNRLVALAGVPRIRIHDHRHTHVTLAIQSGANIKAISQRVGHARTSITMDLYAHAMPDAHAEVANKIGGLLFGTNSVGAESETDADKS